MQGRIKLNRTTLSIILSIVLISVFSLSIAYAALSVTLNIVGTAEISDASWNVRFDNIKVNPASVTISPKITNNTTITFSANLTEPGDFYKFNVDIVNDGSIDAMIDSIVKTPELTTDQKKYLRYEVEYIDGQSINTKQILKAKETKTISVLFSFRNDIPISDLPASSSNFNVQIQLVYYQADNTATQITNGVSKVNVVTGDIDTVGSEVCIGKECFYLMYNNGYSVTMLSKYNLYVGYYCSNKQSTCTPYGEEATGIQDSKMVGWQMGTEERHGVLPFSLSNYWPAGTIERTYVYNENSLLYNYVENYRTYLESFNIKLLDARLINNEEVLNLGCLTDGGQYGGDCSKAPSWVYNISYWTGAASGDWGVYRVDYNGFGTNPYSNDYDFGIRPVIEIPLTEL